MFDPKSRYFDLPNRIFRSADGTEYVYKARRFLPLPPSTPTSRQLGTEVSVEPGDRLDTIASRELGDPLEFWRLVDANNGLNPFDLTRPGTQLRIPPASANSDSIDGSEM